MPVTSARTAAQLASVQLAAPWGGTGYLSDLGGPTHWVDFGGPRGAAPLLLVHGLGGSHLNWVLVAAALAERRRVVALDLAGFGLTRPGRRRTTVSANAGLVARFVEEVLGEPAVLVGNSMGGMITIHVAADSPQLVAGAVLVDPALPLPPRQRPDLRVAREFLVFSTPVVGELAMRASTMRLTPRQQVLRSMELCFVDPARMDPDLVAAGTELVAIRRRHPGNEQAFLWAARSLMLVSAKRAAYRRRWMDITAPTLLVHGERDRLVSIDAARSLAADRPDWAHAFVPDVGHTPQLEVPDRFVDVVDGWLAQRAADG